MNIEIAISAHLAADQKVQVTRYDIEGEEKETHVLVRGQSPKITFHGEGVFSAFYVDEVDTGDEDDEKDE